MNLSENNSDRYDNISKSNILGIDYLNDSNNFLMNRTYTACRLPNDGLRK